MQSGLEIVKLYSGHTPSALRELSIPQDDVIEACSLRATDLVLTLKYSESSVIRNPIGQMAQRFHSDK